MGDPQKVGDPINAHIVYTVTTYVSFLASSSSPRSLTGCAIQTTAAEYKKTSFSVLRRYSDFLWLFDALVLNNPGVIIPPVPEKKPYGRFAETFVESRRMALNKCLQKIVNNPRLAKDQDLKLFLESDSFALDVSRDSCSTGPVHRTFGIPIKIKHRRSDTNQGGLIASIGSLTGSKFYETDEVPPYTPSSSD